MMKSFITRTPIPALACGFAFSISPVQAQDVDAAHADHDVSEGYDDVAAVPQDGMAEPPVGAPVQEEPMGPRNPPPRLDTNEDGVPDAWDQDGDGRADAWDLDGDANPDALDSDGDGSPDVYRKGMAPVEGPEPGMADEPNPR